MFALFELTLCKFTSRKIPPKLFFFFTPLTYRFPFLSIDHICRSVNLTIMATYEMAVLLLRY